MTPSTKKRFWKETSIAACDGGFEIKLDARTVKTPAKATMLIPTKALAEAIAVEWAAVEDRIDPTAMPMTRRANAAIDKVTIQHRAVADMLAEYAGSDLLCYRAVTPQELASRQADVWDPLLDWAEAHLGVRLSTTIGVMHVQQSDENIRLLSAKAHAMTPFALTGFHDLVTLSGSFIVGLAAIENHQTPEALWNASQADELWQQEKWGFDDEAAHHLALKKQDFLDALAFYKLSLAC